MKTRIRSIIERVLGYILLGVAVLVFSVFYTNINKTQKSKIDELKRRLEDLRAGELKATTDFQQRKEQIDRINQQLEVRQKEVREKFESLLDKQVNYPKFIEQVQRKAKALDISILTSQYDPPSRVQGAPAAYLEFRFTMNVNGGYEKMKRFLWEIENSMGRFVKIGAMNIKPPICDKEGFMNLSITLSTFFLP